MVVLDLGELLFSVVFSYMGALEFFFIARNLYHWGFQHHKRLIELSDDSDGLSELQEKIKAAIGEAKEKERYGLNAMKDGVLYKDGFRVSPDNETIANERHIIGSSRNSLEKKEDSVKVERGLVVEQKSQKENSTQLESKEKQQQEVTEEPFIKKNVEYDSSATHKEQTNTTAVDDERTNLTQTIKTQFGQTGNDQYSLKSSESPPADERPVLAVGKSDDSSSNEPPSTQRSGLSNQESSSLETTVSVPEMYFDEYERPEPDGQDVNEPQYSDDYLRSLDGIKYRPLVREDGTGRRRAFKKRRSSGDSTSSRESRASREEEVKMFTSLEEEEFEAIKRGDSEYTPIRYSSDPNLKVKHTKRHKRSPVKGSKESEESRSSLEMLDEEGGNPWGDVKPEHYKDMEFWKREKATSIEEEENEDNLKDSTVKNKKSGSPTNEDKLTEKISSPSLARNIPSLSSFEEATESQHENVISTLQRNLSRDLDSTDKKENDSGISDSAKNVSTNEAEQISHLPTIAENTAAFASSNDNQKSFETDENVAHDQREDELMETLSSKLRRSPRQDDIKHYEEHFIEEEKRASRTPSPKFQGSKFSSPSLEQNTNELNLQTEENLKTENRSSDGKTSPNQTPLIEIDYAPDDPSTSHLGLANYESESEEEDKGQPTSDLLDGISDFYDFNASINPSRGASRSRSVSQSRVSKSPSKFVQKSSISRSREASPLQKKKLTLDLHPPQSPQVKVFLV